MSVSSFQRFSNTRVGSGSGKRQRLDDLLAVGCGGVFAVVVIAVDASRCQSLFTETIVLRDCTVAAVVVAACPRRTPGGALAAAVCRGGDVAGVAVADRSGNALGIAQPAAVCRGRGIAAVVVS